MARTRPFVLLLLSTVTIRSFIALLLSLCSNVLSKSAVDVFRRAEALSPNLIERQPELAQYSRTLDKRASPYLTAATQTMYIEFAVNGSAIPDVDFDVGESYAGLLPISASPNETRQLFFWFVPFTGDVSFGMLD
ncbi:MAG: hypothetical protein Q9219_003206 [cf. Caloplaca sp. 3 TL-2023]